MDPSGDDLQCLGSDIDPCTLSEDTACHEQSGCYVLDTRSQLVAHVIIGRVNLAFVINGYDEVANDKPCNDSAKRKLYISHITVAGKN